MTQDKQQVALDFEQALSELEALLTSEELALARRRWRLAGTPVTDGGYLPVLQAEPSALARPAQWRRGRGQGVSGDGGR